MGVIETQQTLHAHYTKQIDERQTRGDTPHEAADSRLPATHANAFILYIQDEIASSIYILPSSFLSSKPKHFWRMVYARTCTWISQRFLLLSFLQNLQILHSNNVESLRQLVPEEYLPVHSIYHAEKIFMLSFVTWLGPLFCVDGSCKCTSLKISCPIYMHATNNCHWIWVHKTYGTKH